MKQKEENGVAKTQVDLATALSRIPGGWFGSFPILAKVARKDDNSEAAKLILAWDELGGNKTVTPEEIAEAAGMTPAHMLGVVAEAAYENGVRVAKLIEGLDLETIMERAVREAKKPNGFKDRERILQSAGLYPTTGGATFINNNNNQLSASLRAGVEQDGLGTMEEDTVEFTTLVRGAEDARRIVSPSKMIEGAIEVEVVDDPGK